MASKRYRADEPYPWEYRVTDLLEGRYVATCTIKGMAEVIAAALNAAEGAGRAEEFRESARFITRLASQYGTALRAIAHLGCENDAATARQALKAETKESTTNAE